MSYRGKHPGVGRAVQVRIQQIFTAEKGKCNVSDFSDGSDKKWEALSAVFQNVRCCIAEDIVGGDGDRELEFCACR